LFKNFYWAIKNKTKFFLPYPSINIATDLNIINIVNLIIFIIVILAIFTILFLLILFKISINAEKLLVFLQNYPKFIKIIKILNNFFNIG